MESKKGFVFVETMIVVVALVTILMVLYSAYSGVITIERRRNRYDDPMYIYKTYSIAKVLETLKTDTSNGSKLKRLVYQLERVNCSDCANIISVSINDANLYDCIGSTESFSSENTQLSESSSSQSSVASCRSHGGDATNMIMQQYIGKLFNDYHVSPSGGAVILNAKAIEIYKNNNEAAKANLSVKIDDSDMVQYIKTINQRPGYHYLVVQYAEKRNGDPCDPNDTTKDAVTSNGGKVKLTENYNNEFACTLYYSSIEMKIL